ERGGEQLMGVGVGQDLDLVDGHHDRLQGRTGARDERDVASGLATRQRLLAVVRLLALGVQLAHLALLAHGRSRVADASGGSATRAEGRLPWLRMENLGLVGWSDAGSNRLFSALTGLADPGLFESAVGIAHVPDERLERL